MHVARVVADDAELADAVADHVGDGWPRGEPAVLVVTREHERLVLERLRARRVPTDRILVADARETLESILEDGQPSAKRFATVIGSVLDEARRRFGRKPPRVFGEMVDLLVHDGRVEAAAALEELWGALGTRRAFSLLCTYRLDVFDPDVQARVMPHVCRTHTQVAAAADEHAFSRAVEAAVEDVLGPADAELVRAVAEADSLRGRVGRGQLALMWVARAMPFRAPQVLAAARERYSASA